MADTGGRSESGDTTTRAVIRLRLAVFALLSLLVGFGLAELVEQPQEISPPLPTDTAAPIALPTAAGAPPLPQHVVVPNVVGLTVREARRVLSSVGLTVVLDEFEVKAGTGPRSRVFSQSPSAGSTAPRPYVAALRTRDGLAIQGEKQAP